MTVSEKGEGQNKKAGLCLAEPPPARVALGRWFWPSMSCNTAQLLQTQCRLGGPTQREQLASRTCGHRFLPQRKYARHISLTARKRSSGDPELDGRTADSSQAPAAIMATGQNPFPDIRRVRRPNECDRLSRELEKVPAGHGNVRKRDTSTHISNIFGGPSGVVRLSNRKPVVVD